MRFFWITVCALLLAVPARAGILPSYEPREGTVVAGDLTSVGSDTMGELMEAWSAAFVERHPEIGFTVDSRGSNTAQPALVDGTSLIAPMSRAMTAGEISAFRNRYGYQPTGIVVALDALAVYVHKDNPVRGLTMAQLDQIFSSTHLCGGEDITRWQQVVRGAPSLGDVALHSRNTLSGTYDFFRSRALCDGEFKPGVSYHPGSRAVVDAVAADVNAIGYSGLGYSTDGVRAIPIGVGPDIDNARFFPVIVERHAQSPDPALRHAFVIDGRYPLSRPLYLYVNKAPDAPLPPSLEAFLTFALSAQGQALVEDIGYVPLPEDAVREQRSKYDPTVRRRWWWFN